MPNADALTTNSISSGTNFRFNTERGDGTLRTREHFFLIIKYFFSNFEIVLQEHMQTILLNAVNILLSCHRVALLY